MQHKRQLLVIFLKYPEVGKVKTRLAAGIGGAAAAAVYRELVALTLSVAGQWAQGPGRDVWLCFDPPEGEQSVRRWLADPLSRWTTPIKWRPQRAGDLGERLAAVFSDGFRTGYQYVMAIGTDCPELTCAGLEAAVDALGRSEMSLGPTPDGGYYFIGLARPAPAVFESIPWSTNRALEATVAAAREAGLTVEFLPPLPDVDTHEDWRSWLSRAGRAQADETI